MLEQGCSGSRQLGVGNLGSRGGREQRQMGMNTKVGESWWEPEHGEFIDEKQKIIRHVRTEAGKRGEK